MKIIAQAQVPASLGYLHLGYTSAQSIRPEPTLNVSGILLVSLGAVIVAAGTARCVSNLSRRVRGGWQRPLAAMILGVLLLFSGGFIWNKARARGVRYYPHPEAVTETRLLLMYSKLAAERGLKYKSEWLELPPPPGDSHSDGWMRPLQIRNTERDGKQLPKVVSAGADGLFDTPDDLTFSGGPEELARF